jgi:hypothetical protein
METSNMTPEEKKLLKPMLVGGIIALVGLLSFLIFLLTTRQFVAQIIVYEVGLAIGIIAAAVPNLRLYQDIMNDSVLTGHGVVTKVGQGMSANNFFISLDVFDKAKIKINSKERNTFLVGDKVHFRITPRGKRLVGFSKG